MEVLGLERSPTGWAEGLIGQGGLHPLGQARALTKGSGRSPSAGTQM